MTDRTLIVSREGRGLAILATDIKQMHPYYLMSEAPDGTLILEPAVVQPRQVD